MGNCACALKDYYTTTTTTSTPVYHHGRQQRRLKAESTKPEKTNMIKVVTTTGGVMELYSPITVEQITSEFPNHGIFLNPSPNPNPNSNRPMLHNDSLIPGQLYYLLPLTRVAATEASTNTVPSTPYRMSVDSGTRVVYKNQPDTEAVPTPRNNNNGSGVWKVRLVINPEQLSEILSQENKTQQLIESVRTVAKCGSGSGSGNATTPRQAKTSSSLSLSLSSSAGSSSTPNYSDQCSVSS